MAGLLKCKQLVIAFLFGSNGHKCTEFRDENAAPLSVRAIRENCRRAEKRSADATRVKDGA